MVFISYLLIETRFSIWILIWFQSSYFIKIVQLLVNFTVWDLIQYLCVKLVPIQSFLPTFNKFIDIY